MFGKVLEGMDLVKEIEGVGSGSGATSKVDSPLCSGVLWSDSGSVGFLRAAADCRVVVGVCVCDYV